MKKWSEKTILEKVADIIAIVALCVWFVTERLEGNSETVGIGSSVAIFVVCICEAISFWNVKRVFSYVAIGGAVLLAAVVVLQLMLLA